MRPAPASAHIAPRPRAARLAAGAALLIAATTPRGALAQRTRGERAASDPRWATIGRIFGQKGESEEGYFRVNLPRTDLHVRIGADTLSPRFEFTSYVGFVPVGRAGVLAMGEIIVRDDEVSAALAEAHRRRVRVTALHNHLIGETPRIMYIHVMTQGPADSVATALHAIFAATATPLTPSGEQRAAPGWEAVDSVLGRHSEAEGSIAEYEFPRRERLTVHGRPVKSSGMLETASEAVFERLADGRVASTGELYVLPGEVDPVTRALDGHGLHVTAVHNHMLDETPTMYWIHWYATGDAATLARGVRAALERTRGARRSAGETP